MNITYNNKMLFWFTLILICLTAAVVFIFVFKTIEITVQSKMQIDQYGSTNLIIPSVEINKFRVNDKIGYKINDKFFSAIITKITYDNKSNLFAASIDRTNKFLIPGAWLDVDIFKESKTLLSMLLSV